MWRLGCKEVCTMEGCEWCLVSTVGQEWCCMLLRTPTSLLFKLDFPCWNNEIEYEDLIIGLISVMQMGIQSLCVHWDSKLTINQVNGLHPKEIALLPTNYSTLVDKIFLKNFNLNMCLEPTQAWWCITHIGFKSLWPSRGSWPEDNNFVSRLNRLNL